MREREREREREKDRKREREKEREPVELEVGIGASDILEPTLDPLGPRHPERHPAPCALICPTP